MLGLPARLGDQYDGKTFSLQGYKVKVLSVAEARKLSPTRARKPHRIVAECKTCGRWIPVARLRQHEPACAREAEAYSLPQPRTPANATNPPELGRFRR